MNQAPRNIDHARLLPHLRHRAPKITAPEWMTKPKKPKIVYPSIVKRTITRPGQLEAAGVKILSRNRGRLLAPPIRQPHSFPPTTRHEILSRFRRKCYLCGCALTNEAFEVDHIIPIARGGTHHVSNLAASCRDCNQSKRDHVVAFSIKTRKPHFIPW